VSKGMHESERLARQVAHTLEAAGARLVVFEGTPAVVLRGHAAPLAAEPHDATVGALHKACERCRRGFFGTSPSLVCIPCGTTAQEG
jgi:hypothetical protein